MPQLVTLEQKLTFLGSASSENSLVSLENVITFFTLGFFITFENGIPVETCRSLSNHWEMTEIEKKC